MAILSLPALPILHAADGTWDADANGNWADIANWNSGAGPIADGADFTATLADTITGNRTITNDGRTIGNITAADTTHNYTISSNTLTLDVTAGSPTVSVPAGRTLTTSSVVAGTDGFTKTGDGTWNLSSGSNTIEGDIVVSAGLVGYGGSSRTFTTLSGSGDLYRITTNGTISILDGSAFTGSLANVNGGNSSQTTQFQSMGDGPGNLITRGGTGDSNQSTNFRLYGDVGPVTFNTRALEILSKQSTPKNWSGRATVLDNDNTNPANVWVINPNMVNETDRDHELVLRGSNTGDNTFGGIISDSTGIGGLGAFYSTQTGGLSVLKLDAGKWILSGVNTYTKAAQDSAGTIVMQGTLVIGGAGQLGGGSYAEAISINGGAELIVDSSAANTFTGPFTGATTGSNKWGSSSGTGTLTQTGTGVLTLGDGTNNASLNDFMTLSAEAGSVLNLDYLAGNADSVLNLNIGGAAMAAGEYGHTNSGATNGGAGVGFYDAFFSANTGIINNLGGDTTALDIAFFDGGTADIVGGGDANSNTTAGTSTWDLTVKNWDIGSVDHTTWFNNLTSEAVFGGSTGRNVNVDADVNVGTVTLKAHSWNFNGANTITFGPTGVINTHSDNNRTRNVDFNCNVAGGDITLNSPDGIGYCKINGTATFSSFTINGAGIGELGTGTYNGFGPGLVTINSGVIFSQNTGGEAGATIIPNDMVWNGNFSIQNVSASSKILDFDGAVTLGGNITVSAKHAVHLNGVISDGGNNYQLTIQDNGGGADFHFNNANTFGGGVFWKEDSISINNAAGLGTGTFQINGSIGTMDNKSGGAITLSTNNAITLNSNFTFAGTNDLNLGTGAMTLTNSRTVTVSAGTLTFGGSVGQSGTRGITKAGAGTLALAGANTYTGNTAVNAGTLALIGGSQASAITVGASGNIDFTLGSPSTSTKALTLNGTVSISGAVDNSSDYQLMTITGGPTIGGTPTLTAPITDYLLETRNSDTELWLTYTGTGGSPFETWAGGTGAGLGFDEDKNGDGVDNGMAFLLGAADPDVDANDKLPTATETAGGLVLTFQMLDSATRGAATLGVQHSSDLGATDAWAPAAPGSLVPDTTNTVDGVDYVVSGSGTLNVVATIPSGNASGGKLFGRLLATE